MSSKKSKMGKVLAKVQRELQEPQHGPKKSMAANRASPPDVSSIEKASFLEEEEILSYGNPLHSTALEEDFSPLSQISTKKDAAKPRRKTPAKVGTKTSRKSNQPARGKSLTQPSLGKVKKGGKPVSRRLQRLSEETDETQTEAPVDHCDEDSEHSATAVNSSSSDTEDVSKPKSPVQRQQSVPSEDSSSEAAVRKPQKGKRRSSRALSGDRSSAGGKKRKSPKATASAGSDGKKQRRNLTDLDVVKEAFQEFVTEYKESVESEAVKRAISSFSSSFVERITDLISNEKELSSLKKENTKVNSNINRKRARLVDIKYELVKNEMEMQKLQKEHDVLEKRLTDLRMSSSFLTGLRDLHMRYLAHREAHPHEEEVYGSRSLPALILEARRLMGAEQQLQNINSKLQHLLNQKV